jgi:hypothetical protein
VHDESWDTAAAVNYGVAMAQATGSKLPSERFGHGRKAA